MSDEKLSPSIEWKVKQSKTFSVIAKAWLFSDKWNWNVFANIYSNHPLFSKPERAIDTLPFHGGCTYDKRIISKQTGGNNYGTRSVSGILRLGSDYAHIYDDYDNHPSGFDGVPCNILRDANELISALEMELEK